MVMSGEETIDDSESALVATALKMVSILRTVDEAVARVKSST